jgi:hypothetical protein
MLRQLAGLPTNVATLDAVGTVTADDYKTVFAPLVDRVRRTGERLRLLYRFGPEFTRLTPGALWADTRLGIGYLPVLDGCALVSDIPWIREPTRGLASWMPCPVRVYDNDQLDQAAAWLASLPLGSHVSAPEMAKAYVGGITGSVGSLGRHVFVSGIKHLAGTG